MNFCCRSSIFVLGVDRLAIHENLCSLLKKIAPVLRQLAALDDLALVLRTAFLVGAAAVLAHRRISPAVERGVRLAYRQAPWLPRLVVLSMAAAALTSNGEPHARAPAPTRPTGSIDGVRSPAWRTKIDPPTLGM